jgi:hypothetical protein
MKGTGHIVGDIKELADRKITGEFPPGSTSIIGDDNSSVVDIDKVVGIAGIDPETMVVHVHTLEFTESPAAVTRDIEIKSHGIDSVLIVRVDPDLAKDPAISAGVLFHVALHF